MLRLNLLLAMFLPVAFVLLTVDPSSAVLLALTAGVAILLSIDLPAPTGAPAHVRAISLRERARRSVFLRLRDPDASGRPRPRAPGAAPAAA